MIARSHNLVLSRRVRRAAVGTVLLLSAAASATPAAAFEVQCQLLNPSTGQPAVRFRPGDELAVRVLLEAPAAAAAERVTATISVRAKARGLAFTTQVAEFDLRLPSTASRAGAPGFGEIDEELQGGITRDETRTVRLPPELPNGKVTLKVGITIRGHGKETCKVDGEIRQ